ncbi:MAG: hypothetical protein RLW61_01330 [Gammaproteobacteria bacterium]
MSILTARCPASHCALLVIALLVAPCVTAGAAAADARTVRVAFVGEDDGDALRGVRQGLDEANAQGRFLGWQYELVTVNDAAGAHAAAPAVVVAAVPADALRTLAAALPDTAVLNVGNDDDSVRMQCIPNLLHTLPSAAMRADAEAQWREAHPDSRATARAWHATFEKYAAAQLNRRYQESQGQPMSDRAWAGWAAVKLVANGIVTANTAAPAQVLGHIRGDIAFDGQKGADMSFRETGQLRQPLLLVESDAIVGEAPVRGVVDSGNLDSLGRATCPR